VTVFLISPHAPISPNVPAVNNAATSPPKTPKPVMSQPVVFESAVRTLVPPPDPR